MLFLFIILWALGLLLLTFDPKRESTRWASATVFFGGAGGLSVVIEEKIRPKMVELIELNTVDETLLLFENVFSFVSHYGTPYGFLIFSIIYFDRLNRTVKNWLKFGLLLPVFIMAIISPIYPEFVVPYRVASLWVSTYVFSGIMLLLYAFILEQHPSKKRKRLLVNLAFIPTMTFVLITNYILRGLNFGDLWRYNYLIVVYAFVVFLLGLLSYGFMGLKLSIKRQQIEHPLQTIDSEIVFFNHALKNDLKKMIEIEELIKELESLKSTELTATNYKCLNQLIYMCSEKERKQLASDIHDTILQDLIILKRNIEEVKLLAGGNPDDVKNRLAELEEDILDTMFNARETCQELVPPLLAEMGIEHALMVLDEKFKLRSNSKLAFKIEADSKSQLFTNDYQLVIYRIVQELLTNAIKHAQAPLVTVMIKINDNFVELHYQDNGVGTDLTLLNEDRKKMGLIGIKGRVDSFEGDITFISEPGKGMSVKINIPLK